MTLPLRRKRRITPPTSNTSTRFPRLTALLCFAVGLVTLTIPAIAQDTPSQSVSSSTQIRGKWTPQKSRRSATSSVSASRPQAEHRAVPLRWRNPLRDSSSVASKPIRPFKSDVVVTSAEQELAEDSAPELFRPKLTNAPDPVDDPFGDRARELQAEAAAARSAMVTGSTPQQVNWSNPSRSALHQESALRQEEPSPSDLPEPIDVSDDYYDFENYCNDLYERYEGEDRDCRIASCKLNQPIHRVSLNINPATDDVPYECYLNGPYPGRQWCPITFMWKASALCHKPLYFEERQLERYGHTTGPLTQPLISGAHFFANIAVLPYQMGIHPPHECQYALGYYRPGSCAPWLLDPIPFSLRGGLMQAGAVLGAVYLVP